MMNVPGEGQRKGRPARELSALFVMRSIPASAVVRVDLPGR
jgi:hypothetical protein